MLKLREISTLINFRTYIKEELVDIKIGLSELKFIFEKILKLKISGDKSLISPLMQFKDFLV